jgi:hypothetical protein
MKRLIALFVTGALGVVLGFAGIPMIQTDMGISSGGTVTTVQALWASDARTIAQQALEADAIVRVQVLGSAPVRQIVEPIQPAARRPGLEEFVTPYTDTRMRILEAYRGSVDPEITVMQMGGSVPATDKHPRMDLVMGEDPLYTAGTQHILFLVDISGDEIHAPDRKLYRIVNALGRYDVRGELVVTHAEPSGDFTPPTTVTDLMGEIERVRIRP